MNICDITNYLSYDNIDISENFLKLIIKITKSGFLLPNKNFISNIRDIVVDKDFLFEFKVEYDGAEIDLKDNEIDDCYNECSLESQTGVSETVLNITINKARDNHISVYDVKRFGEYLINTNFHEIIENLNVRFNRKYIYFNIIDTNINNVLGKTSRFIVKGLHGSSDYQYIEDDSISKPFKEECIVNGEEILFNPYDFDIDGISEYEMLNDFFKKMKIVHSIIYIASQSQIQNNRIEIIIKGYVNLNTDVEIETILSKDYTNFFEIYKWIYSSDGSISEKISIARNIISLYIKDKSNLELKNSALDAIKSNYKIYLKDNVNNYIEIKSKVIDNITDTNNQVSNLIDGLSNKFITNLGAIGGYILSIILLRPIEDGKYKNIFTTDITVISLFLVIVSTIYLHYTLKDYEYKKKRIDDLYNRVKKGYADILIERDINTLYNNDNYYNEDLKLADEKKDYYQKLWIIIEAFFIFIVVLLGIIVPIIK